jgi:2-oxoglutarate ferredoxin oxidoreductase subunit alpha
MLGRIMFMELRSKKSALPVGDYFLSGSEAIAEGAIAADCKYYAGYPITPVNELTEKMCFRLAEIGGIFMQMEDEIASVCSAIGAVWAGAKAMVATSGPGFSLMQEGIGYAVATETPLVIVDGQRGGPSLGSATGVSSGDIMQAKWGSHGDYQIIAFSPWSVQEAYDETIRAFNCAERYRVPVIILTEAALLHLWEKVVVEENVRVFNRVKKPGALLFGPEINGAFPMPAIGEGEKILVSGTAHTEAGIRKSGDPAVVAALTAKLNDKIIRHKAEIIEYEMYGTEEEMDMLVISYGFTARSSLFAVRKLCQQGKKIGMLRLKTIWPFPDKIIKQMGAKAKKILVPEMNLGQVAGEVQKYAPCDVISFAQVNAEIINPEVIIKELGRIL